MKFDSLNVVRVCCSALLAFWGTCPVFASNGNTVISDVGADQSLYFNWQESATNQWSGWQYLGGAGGGFITAPSMIVQSPVNGYNTVVTAVGADGNLYFNWQDSSTNQWSGWQYLGSAGGGFTSTPAMVVQSYVNGYNTVVSAVGADGNLYFNWQDSSTNQWSGWQYLGNGGGGFITAPSMVVQAL